jgi:Type I phosphodiesterase / nucleotide pyrophosphatase
MRNITCLLYFLLLFPVAQYAQRTGKPTPPKLIIGIVVDQMRYDYLYRYWDQYSERGFKRLLREGFSCENTHYNYMPTYTAPGHAAIYTGTTPAINGIIANEWWDPQWGRMRYVTTDTTVHGVGASGKVGQHSPAVLLSSTITDELRLSNSMRSKVVGVCLKDRGGILPAGHIANACYWFDDKSGNWITSSYYPDGDSLPQWVQAFNNRRLPDTYLAKPWVRLRTQSYWQSFADWDRYNKGLYLKGIGDGMPHDLPALRKTAGGYGVLRFTPFGNTLTMDFALDAIEKMQLEGGTTHGSPYPYDTHVPLVWYGWQIPKGASFAPVDITDITPTLAALLRIMEPNGSTGKVIEAVVR